MCTSAQNQLGCRKWGCNKWGLKGCLAALPGNRRNWPFSPFLCLFRPFPEGAKSAWEIQKTEEKGLFPQISSDLLKPSSLKPPSTALQIKSVGRVSEGFGLGGLGPARVALFRDRKGTPENLCDKDFAELSGELSGAICLKFFVSLGAQYCPRIVQTILGCGWCDSLAWGFFFWPLISRASKKS